MVSALAVAYWLGSRRGKVSAKQRSSFVRVVSIFSGRLAFFDGVEQGRRGLLELLARERDEAFGRRRSGDRRKEVGERPVARRRCVVEDDLVEIEAVEEVFQRLVLDAAREGAAAHDPGGELGGAAIADGGERG